MGKLSSINWTVIIYREMMNVKNDYLHKQNEIKNKGNKAIEQIFVYVN